MKGFVRVTDFDWFTYLASLPIRSRRLKVTNEDVTLLVSGRRGRGVIRNSTFPLFGQRVMPQREGTRGGNVTCQDLTPHRSNSFGSKIGLRSS